MDLPGASGSRARHHRAARPRRDPARPGYLDRPGSARAGRSGLGYEGEANTSTVAITKPAGGQLTEDQKTHNKAHNGKRAVGERGNSLLKTSFKALRNVSLRPWRIGVIVAAALVIFHVEHGRTT